MTPDEARAELDHIAKIIAYRDQAIEDRDRLIVDAQAAGVGVVEIAKILDVNRETVRRVLRAAEAQAEA